MHASRHVNASCGLRISATMVRRAMIRLARADWVWGGGQVLGAARNNLVLRNPLPELVGGPLATAGAHRLELHEHRLRDARRRLVLSPTTVATSTRQTRSKAASRRRSSGLEACQQGAQRFQNSTLRHGARLRVGDAEEQKAPPRTQPARRTDQQRQTRGRVADARTFRPRLRADRRP